MDVVQIALGTMLVAVSGLVLAGPSILQTTAGGYSVTGVVAGVALAVGAIAVVLDLARSTPS